MTNRTLPLVLLLVLAGCQSAYYATMETFGVHKRDILVERVEEGRTEQAEAQVQFVTTYEAFQALTGAEGGELEEVYGRLRDELESCEGSAVAVSERIDAIEDVASDLFDEWAAELDEIQSRDLRSKSRTTLLETQERYEQLVGAMRAAESKMEPVLVAFNDHVLFLKHNLNARAVASLADTVVSIEDDVARLIDDMQRSIQEADAFLESMGATTPRS